MTKLQIVDADGDTIIAVRRRGLSEEQKRHLAIADNRTAELATWNVEQLKEDATNGLDLSPFFFDEELKELLADGTVKPGLTDPDAVPDQRATDIQRGDLFELGSHRLLCGDATVAVDVALLLNGSDVDLVLTDPPYGINIVGANGLLGNDNGGTPYGGSRASIGGSKPYGSGGSKTIIKSRQYRPIYGDDTPFDPTHLLNYGRAQIVFGANYFASKLPDGRTWLVWDKAASGSFSDCELAWTSLTGRLRMYRHMWSGLRREGPRNEELVERVHPTQKPVGLFSDILCDFSDEQHVILDVYLGSGTTLVACERTGRRCLGAEISADYCQVVLDRWEAFTGQKAVKVGEAVRA